MSKVDTVRFDSRVLKLELEAAGALFESINTPRALTAALLLKYNEFQQYVDLTIDPRHYVSAGEFSDDYLVTSLLSKNPRLPLTVDRKQTAIGKFHEAESRCAQTNARLNEFFENPHPAGCWELELIMRVQHQIQRILSAYPDRHDLGFAESRMRFGPGATTSLSGIVAQSAKYSMRTLDCTTPLVHFRAFCFPELWKQHVRELNVRDYSKLTTVPKNAKTDRVICIEPDLNIFVQLGVGALLRKKLRDFGLDLQTQENNQALASMAHELDLATVDLAAASDTISYEVVSRLLPPAWVELLEFCRVPATQLPDGTIKDLAKWSSMGNGYTFELETLIFYATILAVVPKEEHGCCLAYGDDCILPARYLSDFRRALDFLGFKVNEEKTFGTGLFYESCGTDWFAGRNVRPFFLRSQHHDFESICYLYANNARRWACHRNGGYTCDARCLPFWLRCFSAVDPKYAYRIPEGYGDVGFVSDFDRAAPSITKPRLGWAGYRFPYRRIVAKEMVFSPSGAYLASLSGGLPPFSEGREALRGRFRPAAQAVGLTLDWPNLGPWV